MQVVVASDVCVLVPLNASPDDVARWINPGLLFDEYRVFDVVTVTEHELRTSAEEE